MYLQNENYTVYKAYTAQGALDYIRKEEFDLAIIRSFRYGKSKLVTAKILAAFVYSMITFTLFLLLGCGIQLIAFGTEGWIHV